MKNNCNGCTDMVSQIINEMKEKFGTKFSVEKVNLAELHRRTGVSRAKLRRLKANGFVDKPHGNLGKTATNTILTGFTGLLDNLLRNKVKNSDVCFDRLREQGYQGGLTTVKDYIQKHKYLIPADRQQVAPQGSRGRRYTTEPGECYQMDWGFVNVEAANGKTYKIACFAMICHCCGKRYAEFFPNAKQENLFIGIVHAFMYMGIPQYVLTDNMKSIVIGRDDSGHPLWNKEYEVFMDNVGFETKLCKPKHPFTKGAVERLVRYVKDNFVVGRIFTEITDLNYEALRWCEAKNSIYHKAVDTIPNEKHTTECMQNAYTLDENSGLMIYLCPQRKISFDGFVSYEGRRFGVPFDYASKTCRVKRDGYILYIYDNAMQTVLTTHDVTWSRRDSFCADQYAAVQPEEHPSMPVRAKMKQLEPQEQSSAFANFNFEEDAWDV